MNKDITEIKETFEKVRKFSDDAAKRADKLDGGLAEKIRKAADGAGQVVKHIEEKSEQVKKSG